MVLSRPILLMTRPQGSSERFVARMDPEVLAKVDVIHAPLIDIVATRKVPVLALDSHAIFTSANGVRFAPLGEGRRAYCVGDQTAEQAAARGWQVTFCARDADGLVAHLSQNPTNAPLVHLAGRHRRGEVAQRLQAVGMNVAVLELYDQVLLPMQAAAKEALAGEAAVMVPLFSARTAAQFVSQAQAAPNVQILAMSAAVRDALLGAFAGQVQIAPAPTGKEMRRGIEKLLCDHWLP